MPIINRVRPSRVPTQRIYAPRETAVYRWCFTLNNPTMEETQFILQQLNHLASYFVIGRERGINGTPHLQGFVIMRTKNRLNQMKTVLGTARVHLEKTRGTSTQAADYCKKDGDFTENGELPNQARILNSMQVLLQEAKASIDNGATVEDLWEHHFFPMVRYNRALLDYMTIAQRRALRKKPHVEVIWGAPGTGKSRYAYQIGMGTYDGDCWIYPGKGWFDGYCNQKVAIFDDFYGDMDFGIFLKVLDRYPLRVPVKGGFVNWNPDKIYITSNVHPSLWFKNLQVYQQEALYRRFNVIHEVHYNIYE